MNSPLNDRLSQWRRNAALAGLAALALCALGGIFAPARAFQAYWFAWLFWTGLGLGALSILMLHYLVGGAWGRAIQKPAEAASLTLPLMALLALPAWFGVREIFPWGHPGFALAEWSHKSRYLTVPWFGVRSLTYLAVASFLALMLRRHSREVDSAGIFSHTLRRTSAGGLVAYGILMLFATTDWTMSLEPEWFSTMPVVIVIAGQFLSALAFSVVVAITLSRLKTGAQPLAIKPLHDLGNLLLAFVVFWMYVSFSQFLIIWSGDQPREISWYLHRKTGGWQYVAGALAVFQFAIPFALLLSRAAKQHSRRLLPIAALIFVATMMNTYWVVAPAFHPGHMAMPWLDAAAFAGVGGCWIAAFLTVLLSEPAEPAIIEGEPAHA